MPGSIFRAAFFVLPFALGAGWAYTRWRSPSPSVLVMVLFLLVQLAGWSTQLLP